MAVTSLALQLSDYRDLACAEIFGGTLGYAGLDTGEKAEIDRLILRGERTFWFHPPGVGRPFVWSCLRDPGLLDLWGDVAVNAAVTATGVFTTVTTITATAASFYETMVGKSIVVTGVGTFTIASYVSSTVITIAGNNPFSTKTFSIASNGDFPLPSDFESPESSTLTFTTAQYYPDVALVNEKIITAIRATQTQTGYPQIAALRWATSDGTAAQTQELMVWPEPDGYYQVSLPFMAQPQGMSTANPYPRGGPETAEVLLLVILAVCEEHKTGRRGDRYDAVAKMCADAARRDWSRHHNFIAGWMRSDAGRLERTFDPKRLILPA